MSRVFTAAPSSPTSSTGIIDAARRFGLLTITISLAGLILGLLVAILQPPATESVGQLTLTDPRGTTIFNDGGSIQVDIGRYMADRAGLAQSTQVLDAAARSLKGTTTADLRSACSVTPIDQSMTLTIICDRGDDDTSNGAVNAIVDAYRTVTVSETDRQASSALAAIDTDSAALRESIFSGSIAPAGADDITRQALSQAAAQRLSQLELRKSDIRTTQALFGDGVSFYDAARVPAGAGLVMQLALFGFIGLALGILLAVLIAWLRADRSPIAVERDDISAALAMPIIGEVAPNGATVDLMAPATPEYELLYSNLDTVIGHGMIVFTEVESLSDYNPAVIHTALVAAQAGRRVLLLDVNAGVDNVSSTLGVSSQRGLSELLSERADPEGLVARLSLGHKQGLSESLLFLMGPGGRGTELASLIRADQSRSILQRLRNDFDLVVVAAPPLLRSAVTSAIGTISDGTVLVVEPGITVHLLDQARRQIEFLGIESQGAVVIDTTSGD